MQIHLHIHACKCSNYITVTVDLDNIQQQRQKIGPLSCGSLRPGVGLYENMSIYIYINLGVFHFSFICLFIFVDMHHELKRPLLTHVFQNFLGLSAISFNCTSNTDAAHTHTCPHTHTFLLDEFIQMFPPCKSWTHGQFVHMFVLQGPCTLYMCRWSKPIFKSTSACVWPTTKRLISSILNLFHVLCLLVTMAENCVQSRSP